MLVIKRGWIEKNQASLSQVTCGCIKRPFNGLSQRAREKSTKGEYMKPMRKTSVRLCAGCRRLCREPLQPDRRRQPDNLPLSLMTTGLDLLVLATKTVEPFLKLIFSINHFYPD